MSRKSKGKSEKFLDRARDVLHVEKEVRLAAALKLDEGHDTRDKKKKDGRVRAERERGEEKKRQNILLLPVVVE